MCRCKIWKILKKVLGIGAALYAVLFAVFFFDLDGKLLFYVVEPFLKNHYDKMPRRDVTKDDYKMGNL
jgi:hypothetical protein